MASPSTPPGVVADGPPPTPPASAPPTGHDVGLLLLRVAVGLTMAAHGSQKLFGWFDGNGLTGTAAFFEATGYPAGDLLAWVAALSETFGGLALALGLCTPLAAAAILGTMLNAIVAMHWDAGFWNPAGYEYPMILASAAAAVALAGPGRFAVDRLLPVPALREHRLTHGAAAVALGLVVAGAVLLLRS